MAIIRYSCPSCPNRVGVSVKLPEPPRCINYGAHHNRRYVAMKEDAPSIKQQLEELL